MDFQMDEIYPVEKSHSFVTFSVTYMGYAQVKGNFEDFSCTFRYDPNDLSKLSASFIVKAASIDTDLEWRDNDLKSQNWLDAETYPVISFRSKQARNTSEGFDLIGDLSIKDVTKEIVIKMNPPSGILTDIRGDKQVIFSGKYTLDRSEYNVEGKRWSQMKEGIMGVANEVTIEFSMLGKQIQKENFSNWVRNEERPPGRLYAAYKSGGVENTIDEFKKLSSEMEVNEFALGTVGQMLLKTGEIKDAISILEKNFEQFPEKIDAINTLGSAYATSGKIKEAQGQFKKSLDVDEHNVYATEILRHLK